MDKSQLLERYEIRGDERDFATAKPLYERALADAENPQLLLEYGYLIECHGRRELRQAVDNYRRAIELDPSMDKARYQLIQALAALFDTDEMIELYRGRVAATSGDVREHRFLASAYLAAHDYEHARQVIDAGLEFAPDDRTLIADRGEVKAAAGDTDGALADWRRALELDTSDIGPMYSTAFLLERKGRLEEAAETWRSIIKWCEDNGADLAAEYPKGELERVRADLRT
jgi:tetratricopeptide (TPR) repeat protein